MELRSAQEELLEMVKRGDRDSALHIITQCRQQCDSYEQVIQKLLEPVLVKFGQNWGSSDQVSLGQGYVLGKVAEDTFHLAVDEHPDTLEQKNKGPIVIGNIIDDYHSLGRKLVITFLELEGWDIYDLGNDISAEEFVDKAIEVKAPIIAVSAMMLRTAMNIKEVRKEIDRRGLTSCIKLAVGGAVFCQRPELVEEVGADGTAVNAIKTPQLIQRLADEVVAGTGVSNEK